MKTTIFLLLIAGLMGACGHPQDHKNGDAASVQLDNGKRWKANPETTAGINSMIALMSAFNDKENVAAYSTLKDNLLIEYRLIFKNCTMKGAAHEQLHNYLVPMNPMFEGLGSSELSKCKDSFSSLNAHLASYPTYFE